MSDPILQFEAGQSPAGYTALTDAGDNKTFNSAVALWSKRSGYAPVVRPNGVISGLVVSVAASGSNDVVDITSGKVYLAGVETEVSASTDESITRPSVSEYQKLSITVNSSGAIAIVEGTEHTALSTTRGADGGPPWIPTTSIEIAQIWYSSGTSAAVTADEIKQIVGSQREMYNSPVWTEYPFSVAAGVAGYAHVVFGSAMDEIHSDDAGSTTATKKVYCSYSTPSFSSVQISKDFTRPAESKTVNSEEYYGAAVGSVATSLGAGSFTAKVSGLNDPLLSMEGESLFFKFFPDRLADPYVLCQGYLGVNETFETDGSIVADCTIAAELAGERIYS